MTSKDIIVVKASGEKEPFSAKKVLKSIRRAGISSSLEKQVLDDVKSSLYQNIPTLKIYQQINQTLKTSSEPHVFSRYQLKQAIMQLGPSGYPFEKFVAAILAELGYSVKVGVIVPGICVNHEVEKKYVLFLHYVPAWFTIYFNDCHSFICAFLILIIVNSEHFK